MPAVHEGGVEQRESVVGALSPCFLQVEAILGEVVLPPGTEVEDAVQARRGEGGGAAQDASTGELDIQPTLCSPPPGQPQYQPAGLQRTGATNYPVVRTGTRTQLVMLIMSCSAWVPQAHCTVICKWGW